MTKTALQTTSISVCSEKKSNGLPVKGISKKHGNLQRRIAKTQRSGLPVAMCIAMRW